MEKIQYPKISPELQEFMKLHQLSTIDELLSYDDVELLKMSGFGWRLMKEVLKLREV